MKKNDVREWLPDYLMGTLDPVKQETLATYLEQNPDVALEFESLAQLWSKLGDLPEAAPSPALKVRFNAMKRELSRFGIFAGLVAKIYVNDSFQAALMKNRFLRTNLKRLYMRFTSTGGNAVTLATMRGD